MVSTRFSDRVQQRTSQIRISYTHADIFSPSLSLAKSSYNWEKNKDNITLERSQLSTEHINR